MAKINTNTRKTVETQYMTREKAHKNGVYVICRDCVHAYLPFECDNMDISFQEFLQARDDNDICKGRETEVNTETKTTTKKVLYPFGKPRSAYSKKDLEFWDGLREKFCAKIRQEDAKYEEIKKKKKDVKMRKKIQCETENLYRRWNQLEDLEEYRIIPYGIPINVYRRMIFAL